MYKTACDVIYLMVCALKQTTPDKERVAEMELDKLYDFSNFHLVTATVCVALESAGVTDKRFTEAKAKAVRKNVLMDIDREAICDFFNKNNITYMPLKGVILQNFYPQAGMRQMSDNDIYYDGTHQKELCEFMKSMGYTTKSVGKKNDDDFIKPPVYSFEFHRDFFMSTGTAGESVHNYYSNISEMLIRDESGSGCHFSDEDFYIYMIAHEYKHYNDGGTGIRSLGDRYVYLDKLGEKLDFKYITSQLKILGIADYERKIRTLTEKIFDDPTLENLTADEKKELSFFLGSGTFGTVKNSVKKKMTDNGQTKKTYLLRKIFPPMEHYKKYFPFFYKHKILLPIGWLYRLVRGTTFRRKKNLSEVSALKNID